MVRIMTDNAANLPKHLLEQYGIGELCHGKEPLPIVVGALSHAAARAATFFIVQPRRLCTRSVCCCS